VTSNPSEQSGLQSRLPILQVLGLASARHAPWPHFGGLQHAPVQGRAPVRAVLQLVALGLAIAVMAGEIAWWQLAAWSVATLAAIAHSARRDRQLARARQRALRRQDIVHHALGLAGCALVWSFPLLLTEHLYGMASHLALWTLAAMLGATLALTTRAVPLSSLLFAGITGAAATAGFALHAEWAFAAVSLAFLTLTIYGILDGARNHLEAQIAQAGLADKEKLVSLLLREFEEHEADWLWQVDTSRRVRCVSRRFAHALGQEPEQVEGRSLLELAAGEAWTSGAFAPTLHELADQLKHRRSFSDLLVQVDVCGQERWWKLSGAPLTDETGRFAGYRGVGSDVTERHLEEQKIAHLARHDALTGLPNRSIVMEALQDALRAIERRGGRCALLLVDLDRFKAVNDTLGHPIGDKLLVQVAGRLQDAVGQGGLCGRLGGDEFAVVLPEADRADVDAVAQAVIERLSHPFEVDGHALSIGASVGSAEGLQDGTVFEVLMRHADLALYGAKDGGRGVHHRYQPELRLDNEERDGLKLSLRHAIEREELLLAFQPMVEAGGERLTGFEALLRWNSREHGIIGPDRCIPLAEASRLIGPIGEWVLKEACRQAVRWPAPLTVAVNLSGAQLLEPDFAAKVQRTLSESGLPARRLELELRESMLLLDPEGVLGTVQELRRLGCGIALDDFGTGTSSLGQLRRFRFSNVKIDRSFVRGATRGHADELAIVRAVVAMGESIGMVTTAEGVETAEEAMLMRHLGCGRLQGFYYGRPMTGTEALALACRRPHAPAHLEQAPGKPTGQFAAA